MSVTAVPLSSMPALSLIVVGNLIALVVTAEVVWVAPSGGFLVVAIAATAVAIAVAAVVSPGVRP